MCRELSGLTKEIKDDTNRWRDIPYSWGSLIAQLVKNLPEIQETMVQFLDREDPLEKGMTTHSGILAWRIPWTLQFMGLQRVRHK